MKHYASRKFWACYEKLPATVRHQADDSFELLKQNPNHPALRLKKVNRYYSARIGLRHRALGVKVDDGLLWFWLGSHAEYDKLLAR